MRWFARVLHKLAISAKLARTPTVATYPRPRRRHIVSVGTMNTVDTVDTIDDMRHVIAALGGWEEEHESELSYASSEQSRRLSRGERDSSNSATTATASATPSIRIATHATRSRPGLLRWKGKGKQRAPSACSYSEAGEQEVLEDATSPPPRDHGRHDLADGSTTDSSRDTEIAAIILGRSFGYGLRRVPSNQTI